jgi:8-oxo-dGTP pyrophosphatase MutT (NUDIX family)
MTTEKNVAPRPASTILLLRDRATSGDRSRGEIEVFMMVRHYEIDFASGALVFPGGSVENGDQEIIASPELYSGGEGA